MDEKTIRKLQQDIGSITKDHSLSAAADLEGLLDGITLTDADICRLLMPVCANCSTEALDILLAGADTLPDAEGLIEHTLGFRQKDESSEKKQVYIIDRLFGYVHDDDMDTAVQSALTNAVWFGEYEAVKYLVEHRNADTGYVSSGRTMAELAENAVKKFSDSRVKDYLSELSE